DRGGSVVFAGPPAALVAAPTRTGEHLARWLGGLPPLGELAVGGVSEAGRAYAQRLAGHIAIRGARVHNLKGVDVDLPRGKRTVVSGVSGSGKSTLAFDIVFAEGQRRFLDCLSPYARQYITQLGRPDADAIEGIPPTVAIEQRTTRGGSRSNVANVTEIEPFLRLLYARLGRVRAGGVAGRRTPVELARELHAGRGVERIICAPVVQARQGLHKKVFARAQSLGYDVVVSGKIRSPSPVPRLRKRLSHDIDFVIGRARANDTKQLLALIETAAELGEGQVRVLGDDPAQLFEVEVAGARRAVLDPRYFSPRTSLGACPTCNGHGRLDVPKDDDDGDGVITCPECGGHGLGPIGRSVELGGETLPELLALTAPGLVGFLDGLALDPRSAAIAAGPVKAIRERAEFLDEVGLGYLTLDR
ncbi:MAG: excinuclease ABC subunit A, partial [Myxococcales bacterium]|nr:excinuclease ABC subunit A [Myxococcales bacterium]